MSETHIVYDNQMAIQPENSIFSDMLNSHNGLLKRQTKENFVNKRLRVDENSIRNSSLLDTCVENIQYLNFSDVNNLLQLKDYDEQEAITGDYAILTVIAEPQRLQTKGKLLLHKSNFETFQQLVMQIYSKSTKYCLSYSIPFSLNSTFRYHIQLDFDKINYSPVSHEKESLYEIITNFIKRNVVDSVDIFITMPREDNCGVHVQVLGVNMSVQSLKQFLQHANNEIGSELKKKFDLKVDVGISNAFVPGTSKSGLVDKVYRKHCLYIDELNDFEDISQCVFPLCVPPCKCFEIEFEVPNRFNITKCERNKKFTIEHIIEHHFTNNEMIKFIWEEGSKYLVNVMETECFDSDNSNYHNRYNVHSFCFAMIAIADRMLNINEVEKSRDAYLNVVLDILRNIQQELPNIKSILNDTIDGHIDTVKAAFTSVTPTMQETLFTLLHMICWSNIPVFKKGTLTANGNMLVGSYISCFLFDKYVACLNTSFNPNDVIVDYFTDINSVAEKYVDNLRPSQNQFGTFLLAMTHPYDGKRFWNCAKKCSWIDITPESYQYSHLDKTKQLLEKKREFFQFKCNRIACITEITDIWRSVYSHRSFPPGFLVCQNMKIYCLKSGVELYQLPFLRTSTVFETGVRDSVFEYVSKHPEHVIDTFASLSKAVEKLPFKHYFSWPAGTIVKDHEYKCDNNYSELLEECESLYKDFIEKNQNHLPSDVLKGMVALFEVYVTEQRLVYFLLVLRDILLRNMKKKVVIVYSEKSNKGKSSISKSLKKLFNNSSAELNFNTVCAKNEAECKNAGLVEASGKIIAMVDEIGNNPLAKRGNINHCISSTTIKILTGDITTRGWRKLRENCESLHFYLSLFIFCNQYPTFSSCGEAEKDRLHFLEHKRTFPPNNQINFDTKLTDISVALEYLILAFHYGSDYASKVLNNSKINTTEAVDPKFSPDYKASMEFYNYVDVIIRDYFEKNPNIIKETSNFNEILSLFKTFAFGSFSGHIDSDEYINKLHARYLNEIAQFTKTDYVTS